MRRYSRWDWGKLQYDYFEGREPADPGGYARLQGVRQEVPPKRDGGVLGVDLDAILRPLPQGARYVGTGTRAMGEVVRSKRGDQPVRRGRPGLGEAAAGSIVDEVIAQAAGGDKPPSTHPGITIDALDHPPVYVTLTAGLALGFTLGRAFGGGGSGRIFGWVAGALFGLVSAGARRQAFLKMTGGKA